MRLTRAIRATAVLGLLQACAAPLETPSEPPVAVEPARPAVPEAARPAAPAARAAAPAADKRLSANTQKAVVAAPPRVARVDATRPQEDLWQRIRERFALPDLDNALVRRHTKYYVSHPEYLERMFGRSKLYLYHIVTEIERRGLPSELALLPMVESAFNPMAYSRAHASGLWQFIPATGKRFELEQSWWYDERRDIVDSTNAALDYLTKLYEKYGDWQLALASYNWGENAVARAIAKNRKARKPANYASLRMPRETRNYLPKLQALKNIVRDPARYGIDLDPIPNMPYFAQVNETPDMDLHLAAELAEMPVEEFVALNPGFKRPLIRASEASRIVLPADKVPVFYDNLAKREGSSLVSWTVYHPVHGDTFGKIAKRFAVNIADLKKVNGIPTRSSQLPNVLVVPTRSEALVATKLPLMFAPPIPVRGRLGLVHRVKAGDTLWTIAKRYRVSVANLKRWNRTPTVLYVGQKIYIRKNIL
ncbi:MAG TPA: transglycosylase SLT domain-containing protein [Burkholderiales bacterium]|jgi:membrane-bound lytic murein transglycosylase D|nr:transglycosylase SLT domain-containing protein [Burkholderiales bacterium]